jgi:hypothetical protein
MAHTVFDDRDNVFQSLKASASSYAEERQRRRAITGARVSSGGSPMVNRRLVIEHRRRGPARPLSPAGVPDLEHIDRGLTYKGRGGLAISAHRAQPYPERVRAPAGGGVTPWPARGHAG